MTTNNEYNRTNILSDILHLARTELNETGNIGYTMPDNKYHMYIYVDKWPDENEYFYVIEPNKVIDGAHDPMGDTAAAKYNDFADLLISCNWCMDLFDYDRELEQVKLAAEEKAPLVSIDEIMKNIEKQFDEHINENSYGESQAYVYLDNGRSIEITLEAEGLDESEYYYSVLLHCNEDELSNDDFNSAVGVIERFNTGKANLEELKDLLPKVMAVNDLVPISNMEHKLSIPERANQLLNDVLETPSGTEVFHMANVLYKLKEDVEHLSEKQFFLLAEKTLEASFYSTVPLLLAERVDAVRTLLSEGLDPNRVPELPAATYEQMTELLLNCDLDLFVEIVDTVAVDNQAFYAPDNLYSIFNTEQGERAIKAILAVTDKKESLTDKIKSAEARTYNDVKDTNQITKEQDIIH